MITLVKIILLCFFFFSFFLSLKVKGGDIDIDFYGEILTLSVDPASLSKNHFGNNDLGLRRFHSYMKKENGLALVKCALAIKTKYNLNDWIYFELLKKICNKYSTANRVSMNLWFLLGESGYRTIIAFENDSSYTFVYSKNRTQDLLKIGDKICLNCGAIEGKKVFSRNDAYSKGKYFDFRWNDFPNYPSCLSETGAFFVPELGIIKAHTFALNLRKGLVQMYRDYPRTDLIEIAKVKVSDSTNLFTSGVEKFVYGFSDSMKVTYIMHLISAGIDYVTDTEIFGKSDKWMFPEEVLFYRSGDCEDRVSLLFYLLKEILDPSMLIVYYLKEDHITLAVNLNLVSPPDFTYKGLKYYICETSTTDNSFFELGKGRIYSSQFFVLGEYARGSR